MPFEYSIKASKSLKCFMTPLSLSLISNKHYLSCGSLAYK